MPPKTPLPFVNIKPAMRVGLCNVDIQNVDKPLGSNEVSYTYSSTGKLVNNGQSKMLNSSYQVGDIVSILINRFPNKPEFLRSNCSAVRNADVSAKSEKYKEAKFDKSSKRVSEFAGASVDYLQPPDMCEADLKNLEVSDGSFIEFFLNGVRQVQYFADIYEADYFLAISLYMNAKVSVNMG